MRRNLKIVLEVPFEPGRAPSTAVCSSEKTVRVRRELDGAVEAVGRGRRSRSSERREVDVRSESVSRDRAPDLGRRSRIGNEIAR